MRVAHVITRMIIGGAQENTLFNCLDLIERHGDEVLLIMGPTTGPEGKLLEQGRAGGLPLRTIPSLQRAIHPTRDITAYRELKEVLKEFQPDVVHTHSAKGGFLGRAAGWSYGAKAVIHSVHGAPFHPYQSWIARELFKRLERWAAKRCHHMICVADAMTELMVEAGVAPREKFTTIYSGMDVTPFQDCHKHRDAARQQLGISPSDVVFGKIARFFNLKGHEYLIEAAEKVVDVFPHAKFLLVGDGILREQFEHRIHELGLNGHFVFTGLVQPEKVPFFLSAMDCLVHTSLREGLARTLPQALIAKKPVISYDVDGAREVCITGETGFLLPPKSVDELSDAMVKIAQQPEMRDKMGQGGAIKFTDQFRHEYMTERIRGLYQRFVAAGGR